MKKISNIIFVLLISSNAYTQTLQQCTTDNNNDGVTNTTDFLNLVGQFGQNCAPLGTVSSFTCSDFINSGTLIQGSEASNVSSIISYTGGNGGDHNGQVVSSTGVTGLYAALSSGTFAVGAGSLTYMIFGTPSSSGIASFALSVGGQTCILTRTVNSGGQTGITSHTCGATNVHNPAKTYGSMTDQQGNVYKTIVIGTQEWMAENLKTSIYRNGQLIANVTVDAQWTGLTTGAWCLLNNDGQYNCPYGKLYNWYAVADSRNVCPTGWHVPTDNEWNTLTIFLGGLGVAGGQMKSFGTSYWQSPNVNASNESGFSGLPGGNRFSMFGSVGTNCSWWSSTESSPGTGVRFFIESYDGNAEISADNKRVGYYVRCLRD